MSSVLITGAGRGIGRATALRLADDGWDVYAGVRKPDDGVALVHTLGDAAKGSITPVTLDVTDDASIAAAVEALPAQLDGVVNNAGIVVDGPVESLTRERLSEQFDVNVYGAVAVTRAVLPRIRAARGRIVFISSVSGRISTPWTGAYNSSKFALEGMVDALRMELRPWKIAVSLVEPANTQTDMWGGAEAMFDAGVEALTPDEHALYKGHMKGMRRTLGLMNKTASPVDGVAGTIETALTARRPRARYVVGIPAKIQVISSGLTPRPILDFVLAKATGVPRKA
ncbi:MAG: SDR family oxidoreductase [Thermoleophilaceae bacterium]|nr:SDR family oxidoreductase [Thermoleophilaceae bacterium]